MENRLGVVGRRPGGGAVRGPLPAPLVTRGCDGVHYSRCRRDAQEVFCAARTGSSSGGQTRCRDRLDLLLPEAGDAIRIQCRVGADDGDALGQRLRYQQAVERIAVVHR